MLSVGYASVYLEFTVLIFFLCFNSGSSLAGQNQQGFSDFGFQGIDGRLSKIGILFEML